MVPGRKLSVSPFSTTLAVDAFGPLAAEQHLSSRRFEHVFQEAAHMLCQGRIGQLIKLDLVANVGVCGPQQQPARPAG